MKQDKFLTCYDSFAKYLEDCGLKGKTLTHYPNAIDRYIPAYIQKYVNPDFDSFNDTNVEELRTLYKILEKSNYWEKEIQHKTWQLRLKAFEHFISFKEKYNI